MQCVYDKANLKVFCGAWGEFRIHRDGAYIGVYFKTQAEACAWCDEQLGLNDG